MSADIWQKLQEAIQEVRPDLAEDFRKCRNRQSIVGFMNKNFPLAGIAAKGKEDWDHQLLIRIPDMMKEHGNREEWKK